MAALISGTGLGLGDTSLNILGLQSGNAAIGSNGERAYVNVGTGNLVLQRRDELLMGRGLEAGALRTYNSQGVVDGDNNDNWRIGFYRQLHSPVGQVNSVGSSITRVDGDGSSQQYLWDSASNRYLGKQGGGAYSSLRYQGNNQWLWSDGDSGLTETYQGSSTGGPFVLLFSKEPSGNTLTYSYNAAGLLSRVTSASGEITDLVYDTAPGRAANLLALQLSVWDPSANVFRLQTRVRYAYDALNRLSTVTVDLSPEDNSVADGKVYTTSYTWYDSSRRLRSLSQSDGSSLSLTYDGAGRVTSMTDALGASTRFVYEDVLGNRTTVYDPLGLVTTFEYDSSTRQLTRIVAPAVDGVLATRTFAYNANGDVVRSVDGEGNAVDYQYDANGNQVLQRDARGNLVTRTYTAQNRLRTEAVYLARDPGGVYNGQPGAPLVTRYVYDGASRLRFVISAEGRVTEHRYDSFGQRTASLGYPANAWVATDADPLAVPGEAQMAAWVAAIADKSKTIRTDYAYDFRGQLASSTSYGSVDAAGNGVAASAATTRYVYDAAGQLLQSIAPAGAPNASTRLVYDGLGRLTLTVNALNQATRIQYDDAGGRSTQTAADGSQTIRSYDRAGRLVAQVQSNSAGAGSSRYSYDADGRLRLTSDATGVRNWLFYDAEGRKSGELDGNGSLTEYFYDRNDRVVRTVRHARAANLGGLTGYADGTASAAGLAVSLEQVRPLADEANDAVSWNVYDSAGHLVKTVAPNGAVTETVYDAAGRVARVIRYANTLNPLNLDPAPQAADIAPTPDPANDRTTAYFYDSDGRLRGTLDGEGYLTEVRYDSAGRAWQTVRYATPAIPAALATTGLSGAPAPFRAGGSPVFNARPPAAPTELDTVAVLEQMRPAASAGDIRSFTLYDARGQVVGEIDGEGFLTEYSVDANGNRSGSRRYATALTAPVLAGIGPGAALATLRPAASPQDQVTSTSYDALNRKIVEVNAEGTQTRYDYDSVGNLVRSTVALGSDEARSVTRRYDAAGNVTAELGGEGSAALDALGANPAPDQIEAIWNQYATRYRYDLAGRRIGMSDAAGNATRYYYDADGLLRYTINALGEVEGTRYDALNRVIERTRYASRITPATLAGLNGGLVDAAVNAAIVAAAADSTTRYSYNRDGTLAASNDELGKLTLYQGNAFGEQSSVTLPTVGVATSTNLTRYDRRGLLLASMLDAGGLSAGSSRQYDAFGRVIAATDARGNVQRFRYDRLGREVQSIDPGNVLRSASYDAFGRVLTQTDGNGNVSRWSYDVSARSMTHTTAEGVRVTTVRNRHGETVQVIDGRGNSTRYTYDRDGRLIGTRNEALGSAETSRYDTAGRVIETVDARGVATVTRYDAASRVLTRTVDPSGLNLVTTYAYDAQGRVVSVTAPDQTVTQNAYDRKGQLLSITRDPGGLNLVTRYSYDARGLVLSVTEADGTSAAHTTANTYDGMGRRIRTSVDPGGLNLVTQYAWDANNNLTATIDPMGNVTRQVFDANGRMQYRIDGTGAVTDYQYDGEGRTVATRRLAVPLDVATLPASPTAADIAARLVASPADQLTRTVYDRDGRAVFAIDALRQVTRNEYDANGNLVRLTQYAQPLAALPGTLTVDTVNGAVAAIASPDDRVTRYVVDAANRLIFTLSAMDTVTALVRDEAGNVVREVAYFRPMPIAGLPDVNAVRAVIARTPAPGMDRQSMHLYDAAARERVSIDPMGYVTRREFDSAGRVLRTLRYANPVAAGDAPTLAGVLSLLDSGAAGSAVVQRQSWDRAGRLVDSIDGLGIAAHREYDAAGQLTDLIVASGTAAMTRTRYTHDAAGRMLAKTEAVGTVAEATTRYRYDGNGRLVATIAAIGVGLAEQDAEWALQARKELGYVNPNGTPRLAASLSPAERASLMKAYITLREYDAAGREVRVTDPLGGVTVTRYDAFGNVIAITDPRGNAGSFAYDAANRVIRHVDPEGHVTETAYTASGKTARVAQRAATAEGDAVTTFVYDKLDRLLQSTDAEGYSESHGWDSLGNRISLSNKAGGTTLYSYDGNGRLLSETLPLGGIVKRYEYDARGNRIAQIEAAGLPEQRITRYAFDAADRELSVSGDAVPVYDPARGQQAITPVTRKTYDARGNVIESTDANGHRMLDWYDERDRKLAELAPDGTLTLWRYDAGAQPIVKIVFGDPVAAPVRPGGLPPVPANPANARQTLYRYDANGRLLSTTVKDVDLGRYNAQNGQYQLVRGDIVTRQVFDADGNVAQSIDGNGNVTASWYDRLGQKILQIDAGNNGVAWSYDANGKVLSETRYALRAPQRYEPTADPNAIRAAWPASPDDRITRYRYDRNGRLLEERHLNVAYGTVGAGGLLSAATGDAVTLYRWNGLGLMTQKTDANGDVTDIGYDLLGRKQREQGAAFIDFLGHEVRPTVDTQYDGLGNMVASIRRGTNNSPGLEDQVTRYDYGAGGRLLRETDAMGAITNYDYDAAGNITRKTRLRRDADGAQVLDTTTYRYDANNRQVEQTDGATGTRQQTRYDAWGEVTGKGTNGVWQEFAEYDHGGRVVKSNSGDGVTRAYVYDAAGNTTLKIESSGPDLRLMTLDQMLQVSNGSMRPDAQDAAGVHVTISAYDKRNQLTDTWQPKMVTSHAGAQVQSSTRTVQMTAANYSGVTVTVDTSDVNVGAVGVTGITDPGRGIAAQFTSGSVVEYGTVRVVVKARNHYWLVADMHVSLPPSVAAWGSGKAVMVVDLYKWAPGTLDPSVKVSTLEYPMVGNQTEFDIPSVLIADQLIRNYVSTVAATVTIYKELPDGRRVQLSSSSRYYPRKENADALFPTPISTPIPKIALFRSATALPGSVTLFYRPTGSSGPYQSLRIPPYVVDGVALSGINAFDWTAFARGAYDVRLLAVDSGGTILDYQTGTMSLSDADARIDMSAATYGPAVAGSFFFETPSVLHMTAQGVNARSMVVRYRAAGSNSAWVSATVLEASTASGAATPGWFSWNYAGLDGDYEVVFESHTGAGGSGDIVNKLYASVRLNGSAPVFLSGLTPYQHRPSTIRFDGNPLDATRMTVRYRALGSNGAYNSVTLTPTVAGSGAFLWDASELVPFDQSAFRYEFDYEAVNAAGQLVNKGGGSLQLGVSTAILSQYVAPRTQTLIFTPPAAAATRMRFYYRLRNGSGNYLGPLELTRAADGSFTWDVAALKPAAGTTDYEYFYELYDAAGSPLGQTAGYFTVGETGSASELRWVIGGVTSDATVIHRQQQSNAFGEVAQETDGLSHVTDYQYNTLGLLAAKIAPTTTATLENGYVKALRPSTYYTYDRIGQLVAERDPNGMLGTQAWLAGGFKQYALVRHADGSGMKNQYDIFGNLREALDEMGRETDYVYDRNNRLVRVVRPLRDPNGPSAVGFAGYDAYVYDEAGNRIAHTNALGLTERTHFDSLGRVTRAVSYEGRVTRYDYQYSAALTGLGGVATGGYTKTTTDANGRTLVDSSDLFGRTLWHRDLGGHTFTYAYNNAGWLTTQTGSSGQNIAYEYYANGYTRGIRDNGAHTLTSYEYDAEGNKTFEGYALLGADNRSVRDFAQQASIAYDALNRVQTITDPRYTISYEYDAAGNRRHMLARYHDGVNGSVQTQDYWYRYDPMNRFTLTMGSLSGPRAAQESDAATSIVLGSDGVQLAYDVGGQRRQATHYGADGRLHTELYSYTADGYLEDTVIDGVLRARRKNDAFGRVVTYSEYKADGSLDLQRDSEYDGDNLVKAERTNQGQSTTYYRYADGTVEHSATTASGTTTTTWYGYEWWDSAKQSTITAQPYNANAPGWKSGTSHLLYDPNGHLQEARDEVGRTSFHYVTNAQGLILRRQEAMPNQVRVQNYYYLDGKRVGDVGNGGPSRMDYVQALAHDFTSERKPGYRSFTPISSADFDQNYEPISPSYPGATAMSYVVRAGETLRSISAQLWGDPSMWYLIADANGLVGNETLTPGTSLSIPNKVTNIHNNHETFRVYNPGEAIGDITPTVPKAPPPPANGGGGCGGLGGILVAIVAAVATVATAGALAPVAGQGIFAAGTAALGSSIGVSLVAGAVGSIAAQAVGIALGVQDGFSWSGVALAALGAGVSAGIGASGIGNSLARSIGISSDVGRIALNAALGNTINQGVAVATGLQQKFDWCGVAASALGAAAGSMAGAAAGGSDSLGGRLASRVANGGVRALVNGGNLDWQSLIGDTVADTLGNTLATRVREDSQAAQEMRFADDVAARKAANYWNPLPASADETAAGWEEAAGAGAASGFAGYSDSASWEEIARYKMQQAFGAGWEMTATAVKPDAPAARATRAAADAASRIALQTDGYGDYNDQLLPPGIARDAEKRLVYYKAMAQSGFSHEDAVATAQLVDVRREVDRLGERLGGMAESDPMRAALQDTRSVLVSALLAKDVYFDSSIREILPREVARMSDADLARTGSRLTNADFRHDASSYFGALYMDAGSGKFVYANRGSEAHWQDWKNNGQNAFGFRAEQFERAAGLALALKQSYGENLRFTGHSLGGGLASVQALTVARPAVTFNAEGVSDGTARRLRLDLGQAGRLITSYHVDGEMLSRVQDSRLGSAAVQQLGVLPKNAYALVGLADDLLSGARADFSSFGLPRIASAAGTRVEMPAVELNGSSLGMAGRMRNSMALHGMDYVLSSLKSQLGRNGTLPPRYLGNLR